MNGTFALEQNSKAHLGILSGNLTGSGRLEKYGIGTLALTGDNSGWTPDMLAIRRGAVDVGTNFAGFSTQAGRPIWLWADTTDGDRASASLQTNGTLNISIGNDPGKVYWEGHVGGFSARGGALTVNLNAGAALSWQEGTSGFNNRRLMFGSTTADSVTTLTNAIDGNNSYRYFHAVDNPNSTADKAVLTGAVTGIRGMEKRGNGVLEFANQTYDNTLNGGSPTTPGWQSTDGDQVRSYDAGTLRIIGDLVTGNLNNNDPTRSGGGANNQIEMRGGKVYITGDLRTSHIYSEGQEYYGVRTSGLTVLGDVYDRGSTNLNGGTVSIGGFLQTGDSWGINNGTVITVNNGRAGVNNANGADRDINVDSGSDLTINGTVRASSMRTNNKRDVFGIKTGASIHVNGTVFLNGNLDVNPEGNANEHIDTGGILDGSGTINTGQIYVTNQGKLGGTLTLNVRNQVIIHGETDSTRGGTLAPGAAAGGSGTLTIAGSGGNLTLEGNSHYAYDGGDMVNVLNQLNLNNDWNLDLLSGGARLQEGGSLTSFHYGSMGNFDSTPNYNISALIAATWISNNFDTNTLSLSANGGAVVLPGLSIRPPLWTGLSATTDN